MRQLSLGQPPKTTKVDDDDARREWELNEALEAIDAIRELDLESNNDDRYMEDVPIAKEILS